MDSLKCQTATATPAEPGELPKGLAAIQSFPVEEGAQWLRTKAHSTARKWIGNAVPPESAKAIASMFADVILRAKMGETFSLSATPIWVRPLAIVVSIDVPSRSW